RPYVGGDVTPISPHIAGFVAEILVSDNERVHAGQLLVRLDDRDVRATADHAQAVLEQRSATLASLRAQYELQQSTIRQGSADLDAKSAQADFAKVDADRYRTLALSNYGSRQDAERTSALDAQGKGSRRRGAGRPCRGKTAAHRLECRHRPSIRRRGTGAGRPRHCAAQCQLRGNPCSG